MTERADHLDDAADDVPVRTVNPPRPQGVETTDEHVVDTPVLDGAAELQAEAAAAVESGEVDLSDPRHGGPSVAEEPARSERPETR
jgi:hypothetical protein